MSSADHHPEMAGQAELQNPEHGLPESFGRGMSGRILFWIAIAFSAFQVITAFGIPLDKPLFLGLTAIRGAWIALALWAIWLGFNGIRGRPVLDGVVALLALAAVAFIIDKFTGSLPSMVVRTMHVGFLCLVAGGFLANHRAENRLTFALAWILGAAGFAVGLYHWAFYEDLVIRAGEVTDADRIVGIVAIGLLFYFVWRIMGVALVIISGLFLAYCLFGQYLPAPLDTRGYPPDQVIEHMAFGTEGIYGIPTYVSSTYIFLFILFGAFLERAGMVQLFTDVSLGLVGSSRGGAAKVSVISSGLMGTISGSGVANVVTTGQFTIPLMKRFGYRAAFAGGVEATARAWAEQILMPPVMGQWLSSPAGVWTLPISRLSKRRSFHTRPSLLPSLRLSFCRASKAGHWSPAPLRAISCRTRRRRCRPSGTDHLPLAVLVYMLFAGFTPPVPPVGQRLAPVLLIISAQSRARRSVRPRIIFWSRALGIVAGTCSGSASRSSLPCAGDGGREPLPRQAGDAARHRRERSPTGPVISPSAPLPARPSASSSFGTLPP